MNDQPTAEATLPKSPRARAQFAIDQADLYGAKDESYPEWRDLAIVYAIADALEATREPAA
jgi:hypothetical protein